MVCLLPAFFSWYHFVTLLGELHMILYTLMLPPAKPLKGLLWLVIRSGRGHLADLKLNKVVQFAFWDCFPPSYHRMVAVGRDLWTSSSHPPAPTSSDLAIAYVSKLSDCKWCLEGQVGFGSRPSVWPRRERECLFLSEWEAFLLTTVHVSSYSVLS